MSKDLQDLLLKLLSKDQSKRLGSAKGASEIKKHQWFSCIDWQMLYEKKYQPPFVPNVENFGLNNFDKEFTEDTLHSIEQLHELCNEKTFSKFTFD